MPIKSPKKKGYASLLIVASSLIALTYYLSLSFDYQWNWQKIPQYFFYEAEITLTAKEEGTVSIKDGILTITSGDDVLQEIQLDNNIPEVSQGDLVFENDTLLTKKEWRYGLLVQGLGLTLGLSAVASLIGLILGLMTGLSRIAEHPLPKWFSWSYVELIRGTPLLVQIFIIYFIVGPAFKIESGFVCGVIALSVFAGAYAGEIIRAGIEALDVGQWEAAKSLGMNYRQTLQHVILPQALKHAMPGLAGTFISLIKDSSLVSVMALTDLTKAGREIQSSSFMVFETWITVALLYFTLTFGLSLLVGRLENRLARGMTA